MKKFLSFLIISITVLTIGFTLYGCGNKDDIEESSTIETTTEETTTVEETTTEDIEDVLTMTDPNNDYPNNKMVFYFEYDQLIKVEYIIVFDNMEDANLGEELYLAYADQYESITLEGLTLSVFYGEEMRGQWQGMDLAAIQAEREGQGFTVVE